MFAYCTVAHRAGFVYTQSMANKRKKKLSRKDIRHMDHFRHLTGLTESLHEAYIDPAHPNKRKLHYDQYVVLLLLYFFSPVCDSLRRVQQATEFKKVQKLLGVKRFGRSTIAEAATVFDPELLKPIIGDLIRRVPDNNLATLGNEDLQQIVTLVDGSYLPGIARMLWADYRRDTDQKAAKAHVQFELGKGVPVAGTITPGNASEVATFEQTLEKARLYVLDRGYAKYELLQTIRDTGSDFVVRLRDNTAFEVVEERVLHEHALQAGVVRDALVRVGCAATREKLREPIRIVEVECTPHRRSNKQTGRGGPEQGDTILIGTSRDDLTPQMISTIYKQRWQIEIFFRFFKHVLGCDHLIGESKNAIELQLYISLIACLLIAVYTGLKPNKHIWGLVQFYLTGWASEDELIEQLTKYRDAQARKEAAKNKS